MSEVGLPDSGTRIRLGDLIGRCPVPVGYNPPRWCSGAVVVAMLAAYYGANDVYVGTRCDSCGARSSLRLEN